MWQSVAISRNPGLAGGETPHGSQNFVPLPSSRALASFCPNLTFTLGHLRKVSSVEEKKNVLTSLTLISAHGMKSVGCPAEKINIGLSNNPRLQTPKLRQLLYWHLPKAALRHQRHSLGRGSPFQRYCSASSFHPLIRASALDAKIQMATKKGGKRMEKYFSTLVHHVTPNLKISKHYAPHHNQLPKIVA